MTENITDRAKNDIGQMFQSLIVDKIKDQIVELQKNCIDLSDKIDMQSKAMSIGFDDIPKKTIKKIEKFEIEEKFEKAFTELEILSTKSSECYSQNEQIREVIESFITNLDNLIKQQNSKNMKLNDDIISFHNKLLEINEKIVSIENYCSETGVILQLINEIKIKNSEQYSELTRYHENVLKTIKNDNEILIGRVNQFAELEDTRELEIKKKFKFQWRMLFVIAAFQVLQIIIAIFMH